eukprot:6593991-Heterocapsa_arctica.AAC.1
MGALWRARAAAASRIAGPWVTHSSHVHAAISCAARPPSWWRRSSGSTKGCLTKWGSPSPSWAWSYHAMAPASSLPSMLA